MTPILWWAIQLETRNPHQQTRCDVLVRSTKDGTNVGPRSSAAGLRLHDTSTLPHRIVGHIDIVLAEPQTNPPLC